MLDSLLLILKKSYRKEATLLAALNKLLQGRHSQLKAAILNANQHSTIGADILFAAANSRYPNVFSYVLKLGFDPSISLHPYGFNVLHHCVLNNFSTMVKICLKESTVPLLDTISTEGATPLFLAVQQQQSALVKELLARGATPNTNDVHGLTPVGAALLTTNSEILQMLLEAPHSSAILFDDLTCQTRLFESFNDLPITSSHKIRCLNLLLAAGAGLELAHIPESIFTSYGLQKSNVTECLVLGEQQQPDGSWKKRLLCTTDGLTKALENPTWRFNRKQLARTCRHPLLQHLPVVQTLRGLLAPEIEQIPPLTPPMILASHFMPLIPILSGVALHDHIQQEKNLTQNCFRTINSLTRPQECIPRLTTLMTCSMQSVQNLIEISKYSPNAAQESFSIFNRLIASLMPIINTSVPLAGLPLMSALDERISRILKIHPDIQLSQQHLYNSLTDARALLNAKSARAYLAENKHDVATHLALTALALNDQLIIDNPMLQASADLTQAICLASTAEVYLSQGWINKAYHHTSRAIDLLAGAGLYDDLAVRQITQFAKLFAHRHHLARSLALIDKGLNYLAPLFLLTHEQAQAVPIEIAALKDLRQQLVDGHFHANVQELIERLGHACEILPDADQHAVYLRPKVNVYTALIQEPYFAFLLANPGFKQGLDSQLIIEQQTLFAKTFVRQVDQLVAILSPTPAVQLPAAIEAGMANLSLAPTEETFGFQKPAGFTPIVPIQSPRIPHNTLFLTMPEDNADFMPFYKLIRDQHRATYYSVQAIAPKGYNQQGVKLSTTVVHRPGQPSEKIAYGRLKVDGIHRAKGIVEQTVSGENGKLRKLYIFRQATDKKEEQRKGYSLK